MTGLAVFLGILGCFWTPYSTTAMSAAEKFTAPSMHHIFGTDNFGRDIFSRVMQGLGTTLVISTSVVLFSTVAGVLLGAFTGYFGGILDEILMRITDAVNGFPSILLTLVIISLLGKGRQNVIIALGIVFIPSFVRIVRGEFLRIRDADYIKRARLMGVGRLRILFIHILPNIFSVLLVSVMIGFNNAILAGKLKAGGTCVGAWFHFPHTAVDLGSIGKGCNPPLPPVLFHFPHERFNRIHRAPPYWLFRHSRFPFAKKIEACQCRGRPFLTTACDCSILLRSDVHPIPTSHRTTSTGHER